MTSENSCVCCFGPLQLAVAPKGCGHLMCGQCASFVLETSGSPLSAAATDRQQDEVGR